MQKSQHGVLLTTLDRVRGHLERQRPAIGLWDVNSEDQPHPGVLPPDVCLPFPQLDVRVSELQDPGTVNAAGNKGHGLTLGSALSKRSAGLPGQT